MKNCLSIAPSPRKNAQLAHSTLRPVEIPLLKSSAPTHRRASFLTFEPTPRRIKVSMHQLIDELLSSLQPLMKRHNNVVLNGVPRGLCFIAEENLLAYVLWNLLGNIVHTRQNESIHIRALVDDDNTMIAIRHTGSWMTRSVAAEFSKWQLAAARIGGRINVSNDGADGTQLAFSIPNTRLAV